jgi:hypothetical protein
VPLSLGASVPRFRLLSEDERLDVLVGLQGNLADVKQRYAAFPLGQNHLSFRKRKAAMEREMDLLEADIATFSPSRMYVTEE